MVETMVPDRISHASWRQRRFSFGLTVMATVVGGLLVAGILWSIGMFNQVTVLSAKVDQIEENMNLAFEELKGSVAALADDRTLGDIEDSVDNLRYQLDGIATHGKEWRQEVELRLTVLEHPAAAGPEDDGINSDDPALYFPKLQRGSRR